MNRIIHIDIQLWAAMLTITLFAISMMAVYWLGTTAEDREASKAYRNRMLDMEARLPRVIK